MINPTPNSVPDSTPAKDATALAAPTPQTSSALQLHRRPPGIANRPIDPSPIQISHTVSLAGQRPVGVSPTYAPNPVNLRKAKSVMNRPIASNETQGQDALMGYLD